MLLVMYYFRLLNKINGKHNSINLNESKYIINKMRKKKKKSVANNFWRRLMIKY